LDEPTGHFDLTRKPTNIKAIILTTALTLCSLSEAVDPSSEYEYSPAVQGQVSGLLHTICEESVSRYEVSWGVHCLIGGVGRNVWGII
jgi:hypothetical protein